MEELFVQVFAIAFRSRTGSLVSQSESSEHLSFQSKSFLLFSRDRIYICNVLVHCRNHKDFLWRVRQLFNFRSVVHLITDDSEKYQREAAGWVDGMLGLVAVTGVLTLVLDYSNTKTLLNPMLIGFAGGMIPGLYRLWDSKERREDNL